jgi:hypothetical protein
MIISTPADVLAFWAGEKIGCRFAPPYSALGSIDKSGKILGVMIFNMWTEHDIEISVAADRMPFELLRAAFDYVTNDLKCRRATYRTRADNIKAQRALERLGAKLEGRQRHYFGGCDGLLYGLLKEEYRFG